jgi:hypothetical protein
MCSACNACQTRAPVHLPAERLCLCITAAYAGVVFSHLAAAWMSFPPSLQMLKSMAENARAENRDNFFVQLLVSCFEFLLTVSSCRGQCRRVGRRCQNPSISKACDLVPES